MRLSSLVTLTVATAAGCIPSVKAQDKPAVPLIQSAELPVQTRTFTSLEGMHDSYAKDFASKPGFGASRIVFLPPQDFLALDGEMYRFNSPNLLGLENTPIAYTPRHATLTVGDMSRKEARALLRRRPLTGDEQRAVSELRGGQNLVTMPKQISVPTLQGTNEVTGLLAIGALRAKATCAGCHQVKEGTLLGAFAYTLVPTNAVSGRAFASVLDAGPHPREARH